MARGVNKVILIGNLGADPDARVMPSGGSVTNISVATSESWNDRSTGQRQERTEWHRVVLFNRLGEVAAQYLRKGSKVYIEGSIRTNKWQDQNGQDRYSTEIIANNMQMLDSRGDGAGAQPSGGYANQAPQGAPQQQPPQQQPQSAQPSQASAQPQGGSIDFDDDVPF